MLDYKQNWKLYLPVFFTIGLVIFSIVHRLTLNNYELYRNEILMNIEIFFYLSSMFIIFMCILILIVLLFRRKWKTFFHLLGSFAIAIVLFIIAVVIDAPFLLYVT